MPHHPTTPRPYWLALLLVAAQVGGVAFAGHAGDGRRALTEALAGGDDEPVERVAHALFAHGAEALAVAIELLEGSAPACCADDHQPGGGAAPEHDARPLAIDQRVLLLRAIARYDGRALRAEVRTRLDGEPTLVERVALIQILRYAGGAADLRLLIRAATQPPDERVSTAVLDELQSAVRDVVERENPPVALLTEVTLGARPGLQQRLVAGTASLRPLARVRYLTDILGSGRTLDEIVLRSLGGTAEAFGLPVAPRRLDVVRGYLHDDSIETATLAVHCCGVLHDFDAAGSLVELLQSPDLGLRHAAHTALKRMSGLDLPSVPGRWRHWLAREHLWFDAVLERSLERGDEPRGQAARFVNEVGIHRFRRHELAELLGHTLAERHPRVAVLACAALRQLGSLAALPALVDALRHPDDAVAQAALATLQALTGDHRNSTYAAWREAYAEEIAYLRDASAW